MTGDAANVGTSPLEELAGGAAAPAVTIDCTADTVADTLDDAVVAAAAAAAATAAGACVTGAAVNVDAVEAADVAAILFFSAAADKLLPIAAMDGADGKAPISAICFTSFFALLSAIPAVFGAMNPPPLDACAESAIAHSSRSSASAASISNS